MQVVLHSTPELVGGSYLHLPNNASATSYLKAADAAAAIDCLVHANATALVAVAEFLPRGDTFETDAWAPVVDGVALSHSIVARIAAGKVAPGVDILAGSNMDEGTIFVRA